MLFLFKRFWGLHQYEVKRPPRTNLELELLENRVLPSWTAVGPRPQYFGQQDLGGNWTENVTGRISALAFGQDGSGHPAAFLGAASGGVWRSTDFTSTQPTWIPLTDNLGAPGSGLVFNSTTGFGAGAIDVGAIAVDPTNQKTIYVGTGEGNGSGRYGTGVFVSTDGAALSEEI